MLLVFLIVNAQQAYNDAQNYNCGDILFDVNYDYGDDMDGRKTHAKLDINANNDGKTFFSGNALDL